MKIVFDTLNIYYLPQYLPIHNYLLSCNHRSEFVCYRNKNDIELCTSIFEAHNLDVYWVDDALEASRYYEEVKADWVIFGNTFYHLDVVHKVSKSVQLGHGIGPKPGYYQKSATPTTIRFVEGALRMAKSQSMYPHCQFAQVGFSKMDPIFNGTEQGLCLQSLGLDPGKKTLLYAPTFNPSSLERFPDNWPQDFSQFNILIKPHAITQARSAYKNQRKKLQKWKRFSNTYVAERGDISLLPFMKVADILLSEASSTLFEFVAMDRPVIVCDFFKLKWSYRGPLRYRFERRFKVDNVVYDEIGRHVTSYAELQEAVQQQLDNPGEFSLQRQQYTYDHVGPTDGKSSHRIVEFLEKNL